MQHGKATSFLSTILYMWYDSHLQKITIDISNRPMAKYIPQKEGCFAFSKWNMSLIVLIDGCR